MKRVHLAVQGLVANPRLLLPDSLAASRPRRLDLGSDLLPVVRSHTVIPVHAPGPVSGQLDAARLCVDTEDQVLSSAGADDKWRQAVL